jgi:hypothetical protein
VIRKTTAYHVISRLCQEVRYLDDVAKEVMRKQIRQVCYSCGVELLTYCVMGNHFHLLLRVPDAIRMGDEELLERYLHLYPTPNKYQKIVFEALAGRLRSGGEAADQAREYLLKRMGNLSMCVKLIKQRFSIWYNRNTLRKGTLWGERFKSVVVENSVNALKTVAAYIDLNPIRAGLVEDPKDYRYCGYSEAVAGSKEASAGLKGIFFTEDLEHVMQSYRMILYGKGAHGKRADGSGCVIDPQKVREVLGKGGAMEAHEALRCRIRYFTDGCVIGAKEFVKEQSEELRKSYSRRKTERLRSFRGIEGVELNVFRNLRGKLFG